MQLTVLQVAALAFTVCASLCAALCPSTKTQLSFGVVLGSSYEARRKRNALHYAVSGLTNWFANNNNNNNNASSSSSSSSTSILCQHSIHPIVQMLQESNSYLATAAVCNALGKGAIALMGPNSPAANDYVAAIASATRTPHISFKPTITANARIVNRFAINLHPSINHISKCLIDIIDYFKWQEVLIVYEDGESLFRLENILSNRRDTKALYFRLKRYTKSNIYSLLKEIDNSGWTNLVLDLSATSTQLFLRAATNKGMMNRRYHFLLASLDALTLDLNDYQHNHANITALDLVPINQSYYNNVINDMIHRFDKSQIGNGNDWDWIDGNGGILIRNSRLELSSALIYDAVNLLINALSNLSISMHINLLSMQPPNCELLLMSSSNDISSSSSSGGSIPIGGTGSRGSFGTNLLNYLRSSDISNALTGRLRFDANGMRKDVNIDIYHMQTNGMIKFANWNSDKALTVYNSPYNLNSIFPLKNKKLRVVAVATKPFIWIKREYQRRYLENDKIKPGVLFHRHHLEGFCIDMMELIANRTGLDWTIYRSPNDTYGKCVERPGCSKRGSCPCEWNGMMGDLIEGKADIALGSFTITYEREKTIDFTKPFMNLGISILFKKPKGEKPGLFSFLNPLAVEIWLYVLAAYLVVTLMIYALARFSPYEWINPHPCDADIGYLVNSFSLSNSFWFTVGTLMQQGSDINPRAVSTRIVGGIWWFFTLIIISSYTANLAAFLTVERMVSPIENAEDLAKQTTIDYGVLAGGSTEAFFDSSHISTYARMSRYMRDRPWVKPKTTDEGISRVKRGNYAFLMESAMIEYHVERECKLVQVGGLIDSKGYGIGVRPNSEELRDELTLKILELQRDQELQALKNKWWKESGACRGQDPEESKASALDMHNVGGIFVVLVCGLMLAICIAIVEFVWNSRKHAEQDRQSLCAEMSDELRFSLNCYGSSKKLRDECHRVDHQFYDQTHLQQHQSQAIAAASAAACDNDESHDVNGGSRLLHRRGCQQQKQGAATASAVCCKETVT